MNGSYVGVAVHRAARIAAAGHGGQILLSDATAALVRDELPDGATLHDLGKHRLKDFAPPHACTSSSSPDLPDDFPPLAYVHPPTSTCPPPRHGSRAGERDRGRRALLATRRRGWSPSPGPAASARRGWRWRRRTRRQADLPGGVVFVPLAASPIRRWSGGGRRRAVGARREPGADAVGELADLPWPATARFSCSTTWSMSLDAAATSPGWSDRVPAAVVLATSRVPAAAAVERQFPVGAPRRARCGPALHGARDGGPPDLLRRRGRR